ncbi:MAG: hemerythrin domain-containing protein, partial [Kiloniellaceae bacterium]
MADAKPPRGEGVDDSTAKPRQANTKSGLAEARALLTKGEALGPEAFLDPVEFIHSDHNRQLRMCNLMDAFSERLEVEPVKELAGALLQFIKTDLPLHTEDEEQGLFPTLRRRCSPEDGIDEVLHQLTREH